MPANQLDIADISILCLPIWNVILTNFCNACKAILDVHLYSLSIKRDISNRYFPYFSSFLHFSVERFVYVNHTLPSVGVY